MTSDQYFGCTCINLQKIPAGFKGVISSLGKNIFLEPSIQFSLRKGSCKMIKKSGLSISRWSESLLDAELDATRFTAIFLEVR